MKSGSRRRLKRGRRLSPLNFSLNWQPAVVWENDLRQSTQGGPDMSGYDSAQRLKKDDDLGRWRFAAEIAAVIRSTPADWSARIHSTVEGGGPHTRTIRRL